MPYRSYLCVNIASLSSFRYRFAAGGPLALKDFSLPTLKQGAAGLGRKRAG